MVAHVRPHLPRHDGDRAPAGRAQRSKSNADYYAKHHRARRLDTIDYYVLLAAVRYVAIITRMMNLYVEQGAMPPDHTFWLENPPQRVAIDLVDRLL